MYRVQSSKLRSAMFFASMAAMLAGPMPTRLLADPEDRAADLAKSSSAGAPTAQAVHDHAEQPVHSNRALAARGIDPVFAQFQAWAQQRATAGKQGEKAAVEAEGVALAVARREALADLIRTQPKRALELAVSAELRQALPASITAELEEWVGGRGDFLVYAVDKWVGTSLGKESITRQVKLMEKSYDAYVYGRRVHQVTTRNTPLFGIAVGTDLALHEDPARVLEPGEADALVAAGRTPPGPACAVCGQIAADTSTGILLDPGGPLLRVCSRAHANLLNRRLAAAGRTVFLPDGGDVEPIDPGVLGSLTQGTKTLLFMRVNFADDITEPITMAEATTLMNEVNAYFVEASFNTTAIISTITPLLPLPHTKLWYGTNGPGSVLAHARAAALAAGFAFERYDLDIVRHTSVPGFDWGGLAAVGGRGLWLQSSGFGTATHELGHNFGLVHANSWNAVRPPQTGAYPDNPDNYPFDSDSLLGHDSMIGPGTDAEYGDPFDIMGGGGGHFNVVGKNHLGWLPDPYVQTVGSNGTYRVYAMDSPSLTDGRRYALRIRKDFERDYWAAYRTQLNNAWLRAGLELHWNAWSQANGFSQFLDTTPGTIQGKQDAAVVLGRTFSDAAPAVHITPVAQGGAGSDAWMDVVVHQGTAPSNLPPAFSFSSTATQTSTNGFVDFVATATDPNGDLVAYHWDFGDGTFGPNAPTASKRWTADGEYVVRCEVSDMKGGLTSAYRVITVGAPGTYRVNGRILDTSGLPVAGARVHNGLPNPDYRWTYTDSQGQYTLANLVPGTYTNAAFLFGYRIVPFSFQNPVSLVGGDAHGMDYLATPLPTASVTATGPASEPTPGSGQFTVTRTGPLDRPQTVLFHVSGTAARDDKYTLATSSVTLTNVGMNEGFGRLVTNIVDFEAVTLAAGAASTNLVLDPVNNTTSEGTQTATLSLALPIQSMGFLSDTNITNSVFVPGWEAIPVDLQPIWFQTYPEYALAPGAAEATVAIRDDEPPARPTVSILALDDVATESGEDLALLAILRFGPTDEPLTVFLTTAGTALAGTDYYPLPNWVVIPGGRNFVHLPVRAMENLFVQANRTVTVTLSTNAAYTVGTASATVTLVDDDLPTVVINAPEPVALEDTRPGAFAVTRIGDLSQTLAVSYLVGGTAVSGRDYRTLNGTVVIPANQGSASIPVQPIDNRTLRGDLSVVVHLADTPIYNVGNPRSATVIIQDKELPIVEIATTIAPATEPGTAGEFTVTRTGGTTTNLTVQFITGGSAMAGSDYAPIGTSVVIPAGSTNATLTITPTENRYREEPEIVVVRLLASPTYNLGPQYQAVMNLDDPSGGLPAVGFILSTFNGPERDAAPVVSVAISANPEESAPVTVEYRVTGGSALTNVDYQLTGTGTLVFTNNGPRFQDLPLTVIDNNLFQPNRTLILSLFDPGPTFTNEVDPETMLTNIVVVPTPTNALFDVFRTHIYTIVDDDLGTVSVEATDPIAREAGPKPGRLTFTRTGELDRPLVVNFQVTGTASSGSDFVPLGNSIAFPTGLNTVELEVMPLDNPTEDPPQTVTVTLTSVPGGQIGLLGSATVTIVDNDGTLQFTAAAFQVDEQAGLATVEVQRTGDTLGIDTIDYATAGGSATAGVDYTATNGTLRFGPGDTVRSFVIPILDDGVVEPNETIQLTLRNPTGGLPLGGQNVAVLTIQDDDTALAFGAPVFEVSEHATNGLIAVQRLGVSTNKVTVDYATSDGTATAGVKYEAQAGTLQFAAGETEKLFQVPILNNAVLDGDQTVSLALINPTGGANLAGQSNAVLVIRDDECTLEFEIAAGGFLEHLPLATLNVRRSGGTIHPVQVDYRTADGTAKAGVDYLAQNGTLRFAGDAFVPSTNGTGTLEFRPGDTNASISIPLFDNDLGDGDRTIQVTLSKPTGPATGVPPGTVSLGPLTNMVVTIIDDEGSGHVDYAFAPGPIDGRVRTVAMQPDRSIVLGGEFATVEGLAYSRVARVHPDGHLDTSFTPGAGAADTVHVAASQTDGKVLLGGAFTTFDGVDRRRFTRLNGDGTLDFAFDPGSGAGALVRAIAAQADGGVLVGGDFTSFGGLPAARFARLSPDGSFDPAFAARSGANDPVLAIALQANGKILVAGRFTSLGGRGAGRMARLLADGSADPEFNFGPGADGPIHAVAAQPDGRILLGGAFTSVNGVSAINLARLNPDGSVDPTFIPGTDIDQSILALAVAPDGGIFVGGAFTRLAGVARNRFARLNPDGSPDAGFNHGTGANGTVFAVAAQPDGALVIAGEFTQVNDLPRPGLARVHAGEKYASGLVEFGGASFSISEKAGVALIPVVRSGNLQTEFTIDYLTADGTAQAGTRYLAQAGTLQFSAGETTKAVTIPILDTDVAEGNETVNLILTNATAGATLGARASAVLVIVDDESSISFSLPQLAIGEGDGAVVIEVNRTGSAADPVTVDYATSDGSAGAGLDYVAQSGTLAFDPGQSRRTFTIPILEDSLTELNEDFVLTLSNPTGSAQLGRQQVMALTIVDNDSPPQFFNLTIQPPLGGWVYPPSGPYPTNSVQILIATPEAGFDFVGWEGSVASTANPLVLTMDRHHELTALFRVNAYSDDFESGGLDHLPWQTDGTGPWFVESGGTSGGRFVARSGLIGDGESSSLVLRSTGPAGTGSFALRVGSEEHWDTLEFYLNGGLLGQWSGNTDWQTFRFSIPAGAKTFEWRYTKDANFSASLDTAFIDDLYIPLDGSGSADPAARLSIYPMPATTPLIRLEGQPDFTYVLEGSLDLLDWSAISTNRVSSGPLFLSDPEATTAPWRFYRAIMR